MTGPMHAQFIHEARQREVSQSVARPARLRFAVIVTGVGETRLVGKKGLNFGAYMLEAPTFSWGAEALNSFGVGEIPICNAIVLGYKTNVRGMYVGADLGFKVETAQNHPVLRFTLAFEGVTMRIAPELSGKTV